MRTVQSTFGRVPVGAFYYSPFDREWFFKVSRNTAYRGAMANCNRYCPPKSQLVLVLAD